MTEPRPQPPKPCNCPLGRCMEEMYGVKDGILCRENQSVPIPQHLLRDDDHVE